MDNEYRKEWDNTVVKYEQLQLDEASGTEIGRMIKKFPLLTPREYILGWRVWEGKDKSFYCLIKVMHSCLMIYNHLRIIWANPSSISCFIQAVNSHIICY